MMKRLATWILAWLVGVSPMFAQTGGGSIDNTNKTAGSGKKGTKTKTLHKSKKGSKTASSQTPQPEPGAKVTSGKTTLEGKTGQVPQPEPSAKVTSGKTKRSSKVEINPQPLPPRVPPGNDNKTNSASTPK
jgi:hypothetical protein